MEIHSHSLPDLFAKQCENLQIVQYLMDAGTCDRLLKIWISENGMGAAWIASEPGMSSDGTASLVLSRMISHLVFAWSQSRVKGIPHLPRVALICYNKRMH